MDLVRDIYNKLKSRDDVVFCPNCQRILFIPEHFTAEHAIGGPNRSSKPTVKRVRTTTAKAKAAKSPAAMAAGDQAGAAADKEDDNVVLIEARATGELGRALSMAQGESVSRAVKADTTPVECEVHVDGKLAGIYKGIDVQNLERAIKYFLGELKISFTTLQVKPVADEAPATRSAAAPDQPGTQPTASATPDATLVASAGATASAPSADAPDQPTSTQPEAAPAAEPDVQPAAAGSESDEAR
jgi:hypothetical protein